MLRAPRAALAAIALSTAAPVGAAPTSGGELGGRRAWYWPDHAKLQLAGNVGFLSPGLGYAFLGRHVEADLFFGWVPEAIGGTEILSVTAKMGAHPLALDLRRVEVRPLAISLQLTYTLGDRYWVHPPSRFPGKYYELPTALRAGIGVGSAATVLVGKRRVGAYVELVALDVMLKAWADNRDTMDASDVFSLAVGVRADI